MIRNVLLLIGNVHNTAEITKKNNVSFKIRKDIAMDSAEQELQSLANRREGQGPVPPLPSDK